MKPGLDVRCHIGRVGDRQVPAKPGGALRLVQFSDIHLGMFPRRLEEFRCKRLLGVFNHLLGRRRRLKLENLAAFREELASLDADGVICAGDLTSVALEEEFEWALEELEPIRRDFGDRFVYVPGNHDAYVASGLPWMQQAFRTLNGGRWEAADLPVRLEMGGVPLVLLGGARPVAPWLSCGVLDRTLQERLDAILASGGIPPLLVCHFPALGPDGKLVGWRHGLRGAACLAEKLQDGSVAALLSGHNHHPYQVRLPAGGQQLCSGSLTLHDSFLVIDVR